MPKPSNPTVVTNGQHAKRKNNKNDNDNDNRHPSRFRLSRDGATAQQVITKKEHGNDASKLSSFDQKTSDKVTEDCKDEGGDTTTKVAATVPTPPRVTRSQNKLGATNNKMTANEGEDCTNTKNDAKTKFLIARI